MTESTIDKYDNILYGIIKNDINKIVKRYGFVIVSDNTSYIQWKKTSFSLRFYREHDDKNLGASIYHIVLRNYNDDIYFSLKYSIDVRYSYNEWLHDTKEDIVREFNKLKFNICIP